MKLNKKEYKLLGEYFGIYEDENGYELEQWTDGGVDMLIYLNKESDKTLLEQFKDYIEYFDIDEEIELYRESKQYRSIFTIRQSLNDFEKWLDWCEEICKEWDLLSKNKSKQEDKEEDIEL